MARRDEVFAVICDYALDHRGNSPSQRDLITEMKQRGYTMSQTAIRYHLLRLELDGAVERRDGKLIVIHSEWTPPDDR